MSYLIRRKTGLLPPRDFEFFDGLEFGTHLLPRRYASVRDAVAAWGRMSMRFCQEYDDAYIVGPRAGYYHMDGRRMRGS